ncbi:MAG: anthranilate phosphoribosyltransferase [Methanocellales archaeon]
MRDYIKKISEKQNLTFQEARDAMVQILTSATDSQIAAFLMSLKFKGETSEEIAGMVSAMLEKAEKIQPRVNGALIDTCGTGGDAKNTINISTASAMVAAACGIAVAKHGNFSITSKSGSADVLRALGIKIEQHAEKVRESIERIGIGFMLAPFFHPAMKRVAHIRRELGVRTVFNILGPLSNPAFPTAQLIGVFNPELCQKFAEVLKILGREKAIIAHSQGLDEISNLGKTEIAELENGEIEYYEITPADFGLRIAALNEIQGGTPEENANAIIKIFKGEKGAKRDIVLMNSAAAVYISGLACDFREGFEIASNAIDSGAALKKLQEFISFNSG